jgi:hypothetical protein
VWARAYGHDVCVCVTELDRCGASRNQHMATNNGAWVFVWAQTCGHNVRQLVQSSRCATSA